MKKLMLVASAIIMSGLAASAADTVYSVNVAGFSRIELPPGKQVLAGLQLDPFDATLLGLFGTNQLTAGDGTKSAGHRKADKISLWDATSVPPGYTIYAIRNDDMKFHYVTNWLSPTSINPPITNGDGMWIQSGDTNLSNPSKVITLMGKAVATATQELEIVRGLQMLSYPFSSPMLLDTADFLADGASLGDGTKSAGHRKADKISVWSPSPGSWTIYALKDNGKWYYVTNWLGNAPSNVVFPLSQGFWYDHFTGGSTFVWSETNMYLNNLQ
ncbi:MAG: hypothetical protein WCL44_02155 [bacterium]